MGETVEYDVCASGFKSEAERRSFKSVCEQFQTGDFEEEPDGCIRYVTDGWRGGGMTCEELLRQAFSDWLSEHPHISVTFYCQYPDAATPPIEMIVVEGSEWRNEGVM